MTSAAFDRVETWIFDLDNTLYPADGRLFDQIEARMTAYVDRLLGVGTTEANRLRHDYWQRYGTTLSGLMREHGAAPEPYLEDVHDIDFGVLKPEPELIRAIAALPGRRIVFTNGDVAYAARALDALGLSQVFQATYGIAETGYAPKPDAAAYDAIFAADGLDPARAAMFEDDPRNLAVPHARGSETVLVAPSPAPAPHIAHHTDDLAGFLGALV